MPVGSESGGAPIAISYITNYGTAPDTISTSTYTSYTYTESDLPTLSYPYGTFLGWYTTETFSEDTKVTAGDTTSSNVTLYAHWETTERHRVNAMDIYNLAEAIRSMEGSSATMKVKDMASKIRALGGV